jgi:hypothetical protein
MDEARRRVGMFKWTKGQDIASALFIGEGIESHSATDMARMIMWMCPCLIGSENTSDNAWGIKSILGSDQARAHPQRSRSLALHVPCGKT